jgi:phospholipid transport system substrate-binding protein
MHPKQLAAGIAFVAAMSVVSPYGTAEPEDGAADFITHLGDHTLALLHGRDKADADRRQEFEDMATQAFDLPKISRYVLGRYWLTASEGDRQQFDQAFANYMVRVYWRRFGDYTGATFKVLGEKDGGNGTTLVTTEVAQSSDQPPAKVDWSVSHEGDGYKISDVSIEGISQALTYRQEFSSILERNGGRVSNLIAELRQKTND